MHFSLNFKLRYKNMNVNYNFIRKQIKLKNNLKQKQINR